MRTIALGLALTIAGCATAHVGQPSAPFNPPAAYWQDVPCDIVARQHQPACLAEHARIGIGADETASSVGRELANGDPDAVRACFPDASYAPLVDTAGVDEHAFSCDLRDCQDYAATVRTGQNAVGGAVLGALIGAAIGVLIGDNGDSARFGAKIGAADGALRGAAGSMAAKMNIVRNCMAGRGYRVLQ